MSRALFIRHAETEMAGRFCGHSDPELNAHGRMQLTALANLSRWAFLLTFAGVGLRTNFNEMRKQGLGPFAVGAIGEIVIAVVTLGMVLAADRLLRL